MIRNNYPSYERLHELFVYDESSGVVSWKINHYCIRVGDIVGYLNTDGHRQVCIDNVFYSVSVIIWIMQTGEFPIDEIDHINRHPDDNRWENLRICTRSQQCQNRSIFCNNSSGVTGVSWNKMCCKWQSYINLNGKRTNLGLYSSKIDAIEARKQAEIKYFGEFRAR
jgi:hypothetical protein